MYFSPPKTEAEDRGEHVGEDTVTGEHVGKDTVTEADTNSEADTDSEGRSRDENIHSSIYRRVIRAIY